MEGRLRVAACQFPVSLDVGQNANRILRLMRRAAEAQAHVVLFPETALAGYRSADRPPLDDDGWRALETHTRTIMITAARLGLWTIVGSCRKGAAGDRPKNSLLVIAGDGTLAGIYDKRRLAPGEAASFSKGGDGLTLTIEGVRCGFLICHEACSPELFAAYRQEGAALLFHACHNVSRAPKPVLQELALAQLRTRAADFGVWIASSNSSARFSFSTACIARPDGSVRRMKRHAAGLILHDFPDTTIGWTYAAAPHGSPKPAGRAVEMSAAASPER